MRGSRCKSILLLLLSHITILALPPNQQALSHIGNVFYDIYESGNPLSSSEPVGKTQNALTSMDDTGMTTIQLAHPSTE